MSARNAALKIGVQPWRVLDPKWDGKTSFSPQECADIFDVALWTIYEGIKAGEIYAVGIGRLKRIPRVWVEKKLTGEAAA
jgi:hypothetical protein